MANRLFENKLQPIIPWVVPIVPTRIPNRPFSDPGPFLCPINECFVHYSTRENLAIHVKFSHSRHPLCLGFGAEGNEPVHAVTSAEEEEGEAMRMKEVVREGEGEGIEKVLRGMGREFFERESV